MFKTEENEYLMTLMESPQIGKDISHIDSLLTKSRIDQIASSNKPIMTPYGRMYHVVENINKGLLSYNIVDDYHNTILYYKYKNIVTGEYIKTETVRSSKSKTMKGVFEKLFIELIVPSNKTVFSDFILTGYGFKFWKKIYLKYKNGFIFYISDLENSKVVLIDDENLLDDYYGADDRFQLYQFIISTVERSDDELLSIAKRISKNDG